MPAVRDSFWFLARLPFRQRMRPGVYIGGQCLRGLPSDSRASNEKRPREFTLTRPRNTWRGGRAPRAARNVPRPLPPVPWAVGRSRGPPPQRRGWRLNFLKWLFTSVKGPFCVGPSAGLRQTAPETVSKHSLRAARRKRGKRHQGAGFSRTILRENHMNFLEKNRKPRAEVRESC